MRLHLCIFMLLLSCNFQLSAQDSLQSITIPSKYLQGVSIKAGKLEKKLARKSDAALERMRKEEIRIAKKFFKTDSVKAKELLADAENKYNELKQRLGKISSGNYIPSLDTLSSSLKFLEQNPQLAKFDTKAAGILSDALGKVDALGDRFNKAEEIRKFLKERKQQLAGKLKGTRLAKNLKRINKEAYYFGEQIKEYKSLLSDHRKAERKAIELLTRTKQFKEFMRKHSGLASLFRLPGNPDDPAPMANLSGLQTRSQVNNLIQQQVAAAGSSAQAQFRQNVQEAQAQLKQLKNKVNQFGGSGSDTEMPENFRPNKFKTKSLWQRLEGGINIQSQKGNSFIPVTSDIAITLGYRISDRFVAGVGGSYQLGWGRDIRHIRFSHEGFGIRSFIDWKIKGSFWITGGYERDYYPRLLGINQPPWCESGIIGLSKIVSLKSGLFKKTKIQLLWDFLSKQKIKNSSPINFRVGYNF